MANSILYKRDEVVAYVELEAEEAVTHAELLATRSLEGTRYEIWDVWTEEDRWWVVTPLTNLYRQVDFRSMDMAFTYHLGVEQYLSHRYRVPLDAEEKALYSAMRKFERAGNAFDEAQEAEDFQAFAVRMREALLAFTAALRRVEFVPPGEVVKRSNFVRWSELIAEAWAPGDSLERIRVHTKAHARDTWQLVNWLTHYDGATRFDAEIVNSACQHLVSTVGSLRRMSFRSQFICPECGSYRVAEFFRSLDDGYLTSCESCGWEAKGQLKGHLAR